MGDDSAYHGENTRILAAILGGTPKQVNGAKAGRSDWQLVKLDCAERVPFLAL